MTTASREKVSQLWGEQAGTWGIEQGRHWTEHPHVQQRMNLLVSGSPAKDRYQYFLERYLAGRLPVARALTIGCGGGDLERGLSQYRFAARHDAFDVSEEAISKAREVASSQKLGHLHYQVSDCNEVQLPDAAYDVIFGVASIHHIANLERLYAHVRRALRPGGYFVLDEFVGPSQFQWTPAQLSLANQLLMAIPERLRRRRSDPALIKTEIPRPTVAEMNTIDPSEAIRSAEILSLLPAYFDVRETRPYGGTVLHLILEDIAGNFAPSDPEAVRSLAQLFAAEDEAMASGRLQSDFVLVVATPRRRLLASRRVAEVRDRVAGLRRRLRSLLPEQLLRQLQ